MPQVILSKDAQKQYSRLSKSEQLKIKKKFISLEKTPLSGKKLVGELSGQRSLRAWPFRIIYMINRTRRRVEVNAIIHRQGAY